MQLCMFASGAWPISLSTCNNLGWSLTQSFLHQTVQISTWDYVSQNSALYQQSHKARGCSLKQTLTYAEIWAKGRGGCTFMRLWYSIADLNHTARCYQSSESSGLQFHGLLALKVAQLHCLMFVKKEPNAFRLYHPLVKVMYSTCSWIKLVLSQTCPYNISYIKS